MDPIKIKNFEPHYKGESFPYFRALDSKECSTIENSLIEKLHLPKDVSPLDLTKKIAEMGHFLSGIDANDPNFNLIKVLRSQNITGHKNVFVNWYRFDKIDEINLNDLSQHFDDIWYPSIDDIDIFNASLNWILSIYHYGSISLILLN